MHAPNMSITIHHVRTHRVSETAAEIVTETAAHE